MDVPLPKCVARGDPIRARDHNLMIAGIGRIGRSLTAYARGEPMQRSRGARGKMPFEVSFAMHCGEPSLRVEPGTFQGNGDMTYAEGNLDEDAWIVACKDEQTGEYKPTFLPVGGESGAGHVILRAPLDNGVVGGKPTLEWSTDKPASSDDELVVNIAQVTLKQGTGDDADVVGATVVQVLHGDYWFPSGTGTLPGNYEWRQVDDEVWELPRALLYLTPNQSKAGKAYVCGVIAGTCGGGNIIAHDHSCYSFGDLAGASHNLWPAEIYPVEGVRVRVTAGITDDVLIYARVDGNAVDWGALTLGAGANPLPWQGQRFTVVFNQEFMTGVRESTPSDTAELNLTLKAEADFFSHIETVPVAVISYVEVKSVTCEADASGFWVLTPLTGALIHAHPTVNIGLGGTDSPATEVMGKCFFADMLCKASWDGAVEDSGGGGSEGGGDSSSSSKTKSAFARVGTLPSAEGASARAAEAAEAAEADFF